MKLFRFAVVVVIVLLFSSCSITEKIMFNEDNSGTFAYEIDGSKMMSMMGSAIKAETDKKSKKKKKKNKSERESTNMDSAFTFKELFASKQDSISKLPLEEQERLKKMENFSVRMVINEEQGTFMYSMFTDFKSIVELKDIMSPMQSVKSLSSGNKTMGDKGSMLSDDNTSEYLFDGKTFIKKVQKRVGEDSTKSAEMTQEEEEIAASAKQSMDMIYEQSDFKVVYQFAKPVKKVSLSTALYSEDRKTVTVLFPLKDYMENPESLNLEVELE